MIKIIIPIGCKIVNIIENKKYNKSKFLNPSLTGNLLIVSSQSKESISLIPIKLPDEGPIKLPPFFHWSKNDDTV